jgi:phenylpropionate dioxygenase-like ring-hydroxylating dioxygenase large terminal subunit
MIELRDWHPVALETDVQKRPVGIRVLGKQLVLFRDGEGRIGALSDVCPHRRMRLSEGSVIGGRLTCPYHGWNFAHDGCGKSPSDPRLPVRTEHFDVTSSHDAVWIREAGAGGPAPRPQADFDDAFHVASTLHRFQAPLELVLDNFAELEHAPHVHTRFGYDRSGISKVETSMRNEGESLHFVTRGPQRSAARWLAMPLGVRRSDWFENEWSLHFRPVHGLFRSRWWSSDGKVKRRPELPLAIYFVPVDDAVTDVFSFYFLPKVLSRLGPVLAPIVRRLGSLEVELDKKIVEGLADKNPDVRGMRLGKFDKGLVALRTNLRTIYRGQPE